jgi:ABC-type multidrug transport system permease subunit
MSDSRLHEPHTDNDTISSHSLIQLTLTRFREFWREPEAVFWVFIFPILLAAGLGIAFRDRPADVLKIGVVEPKLAVLLVNEKGLAVQTLNSRDADLALRTGRIVLLVRTGPEGPVFRYDDTNPDARTARLLTTLALQRANGISAPIASEELVREPGSRYIDFVVPGLLGMNLMGNGIWGIGFSIVDARRKKLLRRLVASPMSRWQYLSSFLLYRLILLVVEVSAFLGFSRVVFDVPVRGSWSHLAGLCVLSSLAFSALGLLIASRPRTLEGASGLMNLAMVPMWILSGVFFSAERYPAAIQPFIQALPLTAVIDALRANMLQGTPLTDLPWQLAVIMTWLVLSFFLALRLFRWQ